MTETDAAIPDGHVVTACRPGEGATTCAYLVVGLGLFGFQCAKDVGDAGLVAAIRARVAAGTMVARGDNCLGVAAERAAGTIRDDDVTA